MEDKEIKKVFAGQGYMGNTVLAGILLPLIG